MAAKLISLRDVPEDEIDDICKLLTEHRIDFYETPPGNWGISSHTIWIQENDELGRAKEVLAAYQEKRGQRIREEYAQMKATGMHRTMLDEIRENPVKVTALIALAVAIAYFSIMPFLEIGQ